MTRRPYVITAQPTLPDNSGYTYILDSTRRGITALTKSAARVVPGIYRHDWSGARVRGTIKNGSQAVTVNLLLLTNSAGTTNAAWEVDATATSSGAITLSASTTVVIDWLPRANDFALEVLAGGTTTDALTTAFSLTWDPSPAV